MLQLVGIYAAAFFLIMFLKFLQAKRSARSWCDALSPLAILLGSEVTYRPRLLSFKADIEVSGFYKSRRVLAQSSIVLKPGGRSLRIELPLHESAPTHSKWLIDFPEVQPGIYWMRGCVRTSISSRNKVDSFGTPNLEAGLFEEVLERLLFAAHSVERN